MTVDDARLLVVIGKGGVGRSTVAAALAQRSAATGGHVLLVDVTASGGAALALGFDERPRVGVATRVPTGVKAPPASARGAITLLELGTEASLDEYVRLNLKFPVAPRSLGPIARMFDYVATAAPAVREILTIGKIGHEVRRGGWDLVVVDGPATGHVVELLSAPRELRELVGFGPLAAETGWLSKLLADDATTAAVAVTLAEELPVSETFDLLDRLRSETDVSVAGLVVNRLPPAISAEGEKEAEALAEADDPLAPLAAIAVDRHRVAEREMARLDELGLRRTEAAEDLVDPVGAVRVALESAPW